MRRVSPYVTRDQDQREFLLIPGQGDTCNVDLKMQRVGVEEPEPADGLYVARKRHSLLFDQVELIFSDLLRAEEFGRLVKVLGELGHPANISGDGGGCVVANLEILQHPLS
jgi:hypothetical protein